LAFQALLALQEKYMFFNKKCLTAAALTLVICCGPSVRAHAQGDAPAATGAKPAATFANTDILSVALPANARLRLDIDARDEDILGMVQSLLKGVNGRQLAGLYRALG
jgi:hypothetical protein